MWNITIKNGFLFLLVLLFYVVLLNIFVKTVIHFFSGLFDE